MEAMFLLIAISVVFVVAIGVAFWWAIFAGQFDDSDTAAKSILHDNDTPDVGSSEDVSVDRASQSGESPHSPADAESPRGEAGNGQG